MTYMGVHGKCDGYPLPQLGTGGYGSAVTTGSGWVVAASWTWPASPPSLYFHPLLHLTHIYTLQWLLVLDRKTKVSLKEYYLGFSETFTPYACAVRHCPRPQSSPDQDGPSAVLDPSPLIPFYLDFGNITQPV